MSKDPQPKNATDQILNLRDQFVRNARQAAGRAIALEQEAREARAEAEKMKNNAQAMQSAYYLMHQNGDVPAEGVSIDKLDAKEINKLSKTKIVFLVDGSGSMHGPQLGGAIDAIEKLSERLKSKGGKVEMLMFGDDNPVKVDLDNKDGLVAFRRGLNCGTYLLPGVASVLAGLEKDKATQIVIVSDGDIFDVEKARDAIAKVIDSYPKVRVDAVLSTSQPARPVITSKLDDQVFQPVNASMGIRAAFSNQNHLASAGPTMIEKMLAHLDVSDVSRMPKVFPIEPNRIEDGVGMLLRKASESQQPVLRRPAPHNNQQPGR